MVNFAARSRQAELMDDARVQAPELESTLAELEVINRWLNAYGPSLAGIEALLPPDREELSVLDIGSGGGDFARRLIDWGSARRLKVTIRGIDLLPAAVDYADDLSRSYPTLSFAVGDLFDLGDAQFDIVHSAQVLHHFDPEHAPQALARMFALAKMGVVVNDLHRHPLAYYSIKVLTGLLSRNRLIRNDAPISVLRGFTRNALFNLVREAALPVPEVGWRWAFRWQMVIRKVALADRLR